MGGRGASYKKSSIPSAGSFSQTTGELKLFRSGDLSAPNGMIFLTPSYMEASNYGHSHVTESGFEDSKGNFYKKKPVGIKVYAFNKTEI